MIDSIMPKRRERLHFLKPRQVAERLGLGYETVLELIKRDAIPASIIPTMKTYLVPVAWVEAVEAGAIATWEANIRAQTGEGDAISRQADA